MVTLGGGHFGGGGQISVFGALATKGNGHFEGGNQYLRKKIGHFERGGVHFEGGEGTHENEREKGKRHYTTAST